MSDVRLLGLQKGGTVCRDSFDGRKVGERVPSYPPRTDALHPDHLCTEDCKGLVSHNVRQVIFHRPILSKVAQGHASFAGPAAIC